MILEITVVPARPLTASMFSDITSAPVVRIYQENNELPWYIEFNGTLTGAEAAEVQLRAASTANEETLQRRASTALAGNTTWKNNTAPQLLAGADKILTGTLSALASQQEKDLAQAVKTLTNKVDDLCAQNNALIRLLLKKVDSTT